MRKLHEGRCFRYPYHVRMFDAGWYLCLLRADRKNLARSVVCCTCPAECTIQLAHLGHYKGSDNRNRMSSILEERQKLVMDKAIDQKRNRQCTKGKRASFNTKYTDGNDLFGITEMRDLNILLRIHNLCVVYLYTQT